eukprot:3237373-Amphidinium_carterae.1
MVPFLVKINALTGMPTHVPRLQLHFRAPHQCPHSQIPLLQLHSKKAGASALLYSSSRDGEDNTFEYLEYPSTLGGRECSTT